MAALAAVRVVPVVVRLLVAAQRPVPAEPLVPAPVLHEREFPVLVVPPGLVHLAAPGHLPVLAHSVVVPEVPLHLLSRQWFSAAMARSSPSRGAPTYAPVPR